MHLVVSKIPCCNLKNSTLMYYRMDGSDVLRLRGSKLSNENTTTCTLFFNLRESRMTLMKHKLRFSGLAILACSSFIKGYKFPRISGISRLYRRSLAL